MKFTTVMRLMIVCGLVYTTSVVGGTPPSALIIELEKAVHFVDASGSDVLIDSGTYEVESHEGWLRITPEKGKNQDAVLITALATTHDEDLSNSLVLTLRGKDIPGPLHDYHIITLLSPGGKGQEVVGTYTGVRPRGGFGNPKIMSLAQQLAIAKYRLKQINQKISRLQQKEGSADQTAQLANVDLQNALQKQQQTLQMMSNISKMLHDTAMAVVRKIGG